jgi:DegV family protein with EDD domain
MNEVHIITDDMVQFSRTSFSGQDLVTVIPSKISYNNEQLDGDYKIIDLPSSLANNPSFSISPPSIEEYTQAFRNINHVAREVIALTSSSFITASFQNAKDAAESLAGQVSVHVIDSLSISGGLGFLVQQAAADAARKISCHLIENQLRNMIPHIYSIFCIPNLTYLQKAGFLDYPQAVVGELLNLIPLFTLEDGHLSPLEKARNPRQLLDFFEEFLGEFCDLSQITFIQGVPPLTNETRLLREKAQISFPKTQFTEYNISLPVAALLGPRSISMFIMEIPAKN